MIIKSKYKITPNKKYVKSYSKSNKPFGMSIWQIIWACMVSLAFGMVTGFIFVIVKG